MVSIIIIEWSLTSTTMNKTPMWPWPWGCTAYQRCPQFWCAIGRSLASSACCSSAHRRYKESIFCMIYIYMMHQIFQKCKFWIESLQLFQLNFCISYNTLTHRFNTFVLVWPWSWHLCLKPAHNRSVRGGPLPVSCLGLRCPYTSFISTWTGCLVWNNGSHHHRWLWGLLRSQDSNDTVLSTDNFSLQIDIFTLLGHLGCTTEWECKFNQHKLNNKPWLLILSVADLKFLIVYKNKSFEANNILGVVVSTFLQCMLKASNLKVAGLVELQFSFAENNF